VSSKPSDQNAEGRTQAGGAAAGTLGELLRRAREGRGISLREISDQTRISMRHLEAIDADDYKHLPGGIFNRSFIKAYARIIKFDEGEALEAYARTAREQGESPDEVATSPTRSRVYMDGETTRAPLVTVLLSIVILGILVLVVYAGLHWYRGSKDGAVNKPSDAASTQPPAATNNQPPTQPPPTTAAANDSGFQIQVRTKGKAFWLTTLQDEKKKKGRILSPDGAEDFAPYSSLSLMFDRPSAESLEVSINGRAARMPDDAANTGQWKITKDNYKQFLP
jgi:cytoskeletal protein RodZ